MVGRVGGARGYGCRLFGGGFVFLLFDFLWGFLFMSKLVLLF